MPSGFAIRRKSSSPAASPQPATDGGFAVQPHRRAGAIAWRWALRLAVTLLIVSGFFQLVVNPIRRATADPAPPVVDRGLDHAAASQLAVAFTSDYLSHDSDVPTVRATALSRWTGGATLPSWEGVGQLHTDVVTAGPVLEHGDDQVVVQTTARVTPATRAAGEYPTPTDELRPGGAADPGPAGPGWTPQDPLWLNLDVAVTRSSDGLQVTSAAFTGDAPAAVTTGTQTDPTVTNATRDLPGTIFPALGEGEFGYLTAPDVTLRGLGGVVTTDTVTAWAVESSDTPTDRRATATVTWQLVGTELAIDQQYALHLTQDDGRWLVAAISTALEV